jgi:hypothetical protein
MLISLICFTRFSSFSFVYVLYVVPLVATSSVLSVLEFSLLVFSNVDGIEKKMAIFVHVLYDLYMLQIYFEATRVILT